MAGLSMYVLDTSAVLNFLGTNQAERLLSALATPCLVEERVFSEFKYHPIPERSILEDLENLVKMGLLVRTRMSDSAYEMFVQLSVDSGTGGLGVGESAAIAVAEELKAVVVLDDKVARARAKSRFSALEISSTTRLMLVAAANAGIPNDELRAAFEHAKTHLCMGVLKDERPLLAHLGLF